ncbi:uncharacterized protein LOC133301555 [Gastrolobium bilobum]|uniref:uncharacterized protein LOC133301555 n=1 Tax=Gastrolobium bilobum TaxID=150636 RepID=UPI002AB191E2|nr:uncharacterized protein LOC133301555 [Gastrolobium bilobum]
MGQGQEQKTRPEPQVEIQERGDIFFFYRPKVGKEEAHSADDVQRFYIIMRPDSGERAVEEKQELDGGDEGAKKGSNLPGEHGTCSQEINIEEKSLFRLIVMGRKSLPDPSEKSRPYWGFVETVTTKADHLKTSLKGGEYETSTRGHRHSGAARAVGEGIYRILRHMAEGGKRSHTHLIYKLEFPPEGEKKEPQESLNIEREGSFIIQIKNPEKAGSGVLKKRKAVVFPAHLQGLLGHVKFGPADPPDFLNYEGCEFLLISASDHIEDELGLELLTEDASCSDLLNTFGDSSTTTSPLLKGTWA